MPVIGSAIKSARKRRGLTQGQVSAYTGINRAYISQLETGYAKYNVGCDNLVKIAECLDVSIDYILGRTRDSGGRALSPWEEGLLDKFALLKDEEHKAVVMAVLDTLLKIESERSRRSGR